MTQADSDAVSREQVSSLIGDLVDAWARGDGAAFSKPFASAACFVAFDGTVLRGPAEIDRFHQQAFSTQLAGTRLEVGIDDLREVAPGIAIVLTHAGIVREGELTGPSIQTYVLRRLDGVLWIDSFQNTRRRPITGAREAQVWRDFDSRWNEIG